MLPTSGPIEWAVKEAERVRRAGLQSVTIPSCQPKTPWWDPFYKPLWAALQDHEMILAFHNAATEEPVRQDLPLLPLVVDLKMVGQVRTLGGILSSGVPQDYPKLKFVVVEGGIGWVAAAVRLMDHLWEDHHGGSSRIWTSRPASIASGSFISLLKTTRPACSRANCSTSTI